VASNPSIERGFKELSSPVNRDKSGDEARLLLALPLLLLMCADMANSAIEATVDRVGKEYHELSGRAKDMGSAAVFMAIAMVVLSWSTVSLSIFYFN